MASSMVPLATTSSGFEAKLLAARLGAEGIVWQLRGEVDGLYPLGSVEVLVGVDDLDRALDVLAAGQGDDQDLDLGEEEGPWGAEEAAVGPRTLPGATRRWVPALLLALLVLVACTRCLQSATG